ncbi:FecR domain-containing protein [Nitrospirillum sp. BR 11164]|uniref:FecR family protein n=1 Tax=Nitrospirillum sp. BR 11164 TaxID=3104324 RepID=UPI002AFFC9C5|nr:FecR domain-containing protein [Nitrospirillum sp. BR 11164]MEA1648910.1 FecR domain-containing protein [Nitrospirillum sp. BR 11164]
MRQVARAQSHSAPPHDAADVEAAAWMARLHAPDRTEDTVAAFRAWCAADPAHAAAFEHMTLVWEVAGGLHAERTSLDPPTPPAAAPNRRLVLAGIAGGLVLAMGGIGFWQRAGATVYSTAVGEQRRVTLADGTRVILDTDSQIRVRLDDKARRVALVRGRASFTTAATDPRPFEVEAAGRHVQVQPGATQLDIRRDADDVTVTLVEGGARVAGLLGDATPVTLAGGQQLVMAADMGQGAGARLSQPNVADAIAWQGGRAVFRDDTLAAAVAEMNRYSAVKLAVAPEVAALRVSGTYRVGDNAAFARSVGTLLALRVVGQGDRLTLVR